MTASVNLKPSSVNSSTQTQAIKVGFKKTLDIKVKRVAQAAFATLAFCFKAAIFLTASIIVITAAVTISPLVVGAVFFHRRSKKLDPNFDDTPKKSFFRGAYNVFKFCTRFFSSLGDKKKKESSDTGPESKGSSQQEDHSNDSKHIGPLVNDLD